MGQANVLDHSHARDLVVVVVRGERPVITDRDATALGEPRLFDSFSRERCLILAERNTCRVDTIVLRRMHNESAPAASYVEHAFTGPQAQLAANVIQLC